MTAEVQLTTRDLVADRWNQANQRPTRFKDEAELSEAPSKRQMQLNRILEHYAALMLGGALNGADFDGFERVKAEIETHIKHTLIEWAASRLA